MKEILQNHLPEISGATIGLLLAFCFLWLGFFKTIFVIVMLICGLIAGHFWPLLKKLMNK
ncbi:MULTISPECIES: DUF2273 domain-containing protein [unclassified Lactobacillus]|uniref:DUF2273 domain-containing protein n=1 Tax=unclassified Lactobacillus TaxID=2620435 RepID=UPI0023F79DE0|nr:MULTISPECIES: DUF2273 domain-containing protein [unclassified Lactobacillus]MDF7668632.1 DUF2273 domain-containing protein [Lactobacillus sp. ESL0703]WEV38672.1 DUF2273 domain-containing protein [Lactobacillus sp. ESL0680]